MNEILSWVHLSDLRVEAAQNASNLLLCLYVISYILTKRAAILVAFLLVELYGNLGIFSGLTDVQYYLGYSVIYSGVYWVLFNNHYRLKTLSGYVILILFEIVMAIDVKAYPDVETYVSTNYEIIIVFVHLYIIATRIRWNPLRTCLGASIDALGRIMANNYNIAFLWYNTRKTHKTTS